MGEVRLRLTKWETEFHFQKQRSVSHHRVDDVDVAMDLGAKNVLNKSISPSFVSPYGIELDLDAYVNNPA